MPSSPPSETSLSQWQTFLTHTLTTRLDPSTFATYVPLLLSQAPLSSPVICDLFIRPTEHNAASLDPRVPRYLQVMLTDGVIEVEGLLGALLRYSSFSGSSSEHAEAEPEGMDLDGADEERAKKKKKRRRWTSSYSAEENMFCRLARYISKGHTPKSSQAAVGLVLMATRWMDIVANALGSAAGNGLLGLANGGSGGMGMARLEEMNLAGMALGTLVESIVDSARVVAVLGKGGYPKGTSKALSNALANFLPLLLQISPQSAARLELFRTQTLPAIEPPENKKEQTADAEIDEMIDESMGLWVDNIVVPDMPVMNSRAGLYVWLNSLLVARPLIDDNAIFGYLHNRYQGDIQTTTIDLILSSFDVLANATENRSEGVQMTTLLRSFLINKLPLLLVTLSASYFPPLTSEFCITEALSYVDTNAFPTLSSLFDESSNNNMFSDSVRQDFCFACCLHGLIPESRIETLLGDIPMQSLPAGGRYAKEDLVQQCLSDPERAEGLIDELDHMDGNVGAVSQAITEVIGRLCSNKETISLKTLCSQLARKPSSLDVMLLFDKPATILQPICELLDNWRYDDDQGEYQPVYEEFGSILLLVLLFVHRYNLSHVDLDIRSTDSFVVKLLNQGHLSRAMDNLTAQEQSHLDGWIRGLFDNESSGLGDELMSSCPPQDFYLLVPTLFQHIVLACGTNHLNEEGLKGGLEFLVDTFLLPSLVPAITWLSSHLWESRGDANAVLLVLSALLTNYPSGLSHSTEASQMLTPILNIVSKNLEHSLRFLQRAEPSRQDIEPLLKALKGTLNFERRGAADHTELESWTKTEGGGLVPAIKHTIISLVQWGINPGLNIMPAPYTHRQMLTASKLLGAKRFLNTILEEVKSQSEQGNGSVVLDIAVSLICAPETKDFEDDYLRALLHGGDDSADHTMLGGPSHESKEISTRKDRRMNLREALKMEVEKAGKKVRKNEVDMVEAEMLVRIWRRVEASLAPQISVGVDVGGLQDGLMQSAVEEVALQGALDDAMGVGGLGDDGLGDAGLGGDTGDAGLGGGLDLGGGDMMDDVMSGLMGGDGCGAGDLLEGMGF